MHRALINRGNSRYQGVQEDTKSLPSILKLLSFDADGQWEVSALVLEAGKTFGADYLVCNLWLVYRANGTKIIWL